jgi:hypothetical protein
VHVTGVVAEQPGSPAPNWMVCVAYGVEPCVIAMVIEVTFDGRYCGKRAVLAVVAAGIEMLIDIELLPDGAEAPFPELPRAPGKAAPWPPPPQPAKYAAVSVRGMRGSNRGCILVRSYDGVMMTDAVGVAVGVGVGVGVGDGVGDGIGVAVGDGVGVGVGVGVCTAVAVGEGVGGAGVGVAVCTGVAVGDGSVVGVVDGVAVGVTGRMPVGDVGVVPV